MDAIEIYQKVLEIAKGQDFNEVNTALDFARNKIQNDHYKSQSAEQGKYNALYGGTALGASIGQYNPQADAEAIVRRIVRDEIDAANTPAIPEKEAA